MKNIYLTLIISCLLFNSCTEDSPVIVSEEPLGYTSVGTPAQSLQEFEGVLERIRTDLKDSRIFRSNNQEQKDCLGKRIWLCK